MSNKTVFISGGSRGIGKAITLKFAEHNYQVIFTYRSSKREAQQLLNYIKNNYKCPEPIAFQCNMIDKDDVESLFRNNKGLFQNIDVVINNTGGHGKTIPFMLMEDDYFWSIIDLNLRTTVNTIRNTLPIFIKKRKGIIINISSISGIKGNPGHSSYAASKAAITAFSKSVLKEVGSFGITINTISPSFVNTDSVQSIPDKYYKSRIQNCIVKRMAHSYEIASVAYFLANDAPEYLIGQEIILDGGMLS